MDLGVMSEDLPPEASMADYTITFATIVNPEIHTRMRFILSQVLWLVLLVLLFQVSGRLVEWLVLRRREAAWAPFVVRQALGMGVWIVIAFILAAAGLLATGIVYGLAGFLVVTLAGAVVSGAVAPEMAGWRDFRFPRWEVATAAAALGLLLWALFLQTIWPAVGWDANVYHLTVPRLWAENGGFRPIPLNVYSNWPLNTELLFLVAILVRDYVLAKLVHYWLGVLTLIAVFWIVRRSAGPLFGLFGAALVLCNQVVLAEIRIAYVDLAFAFFFFVSFLLLHAVLRQERIVPGDLTVVGLLAGLLAGLKLTGFVAVLCLAFLLFLEWRRRRPAPGGLLQALTVLVAPSVVVLLVWFVKSWLFTGNPVYPFLYEAFGGPSWSLELGEMLREWQRGIGMGRRFIDYLLLPFRVILLGGQGYERFEGQIHPLWLVWIPLSLWMARGSDLVRRCLWISGLYFVSWGLTSQQMRFLIPILPFLATAAACSLAELVSRSNSRGGRRLGELLVTVLIVVIVVQSGGRFMLGGWKLAGEYLSEGRAVSQAVVHPVYRFINESLPVEARLLMVNTNHGFFCHREYLADSFFEASQTRQLVMNCETKSEVVELLRDNGLTHILIDSRNRGIPYPRAFLDFLAEPGRLAEQIYRSPDGRFTVLELR